jgi:pantetheine-phosphate adenylyltransferase
MSDQRTVALYPGTFDPVTNGHIDIIARSSQLFDRVIVAVAGSRKKSPLFDLETRVQLMRVACAGIAHVDVQPFQGLLANEYDRLGISVAIKGLRSVTDFEYEFQQAQANRSLHEGFETMFFMPRDRNTFISSSLVREILSMGGDVRDFVPANVQKHLDQVQKEKA